MGRYAENHINKRITYIYPFTSGARTKRTASSEKLTAKIPGAETVS